MFRQKFIFMVYNKDVVCVIDEGRDPVCTVSPRLSRRTLVDKEPSHDPYIPRNGAVLFNCTNECKLIEFHSITEVTSPNLLLKSCALETPEKYKCETIKYHNLKNVDKLLFLSNTIQNNTYYEVDCLIYSNGDRVCHKKGDADSYRRLLDTGALTKPNEPSILSQDEFICEESPDKTITCDLNLYVPFEDGLKLKQLPKFEKVLLRTSNSIVPLSRICIESWCGYTSHLSPSRRGYRPPGGDTYRCYYANRQQVCERVDVDYLYNKRGWLK